MADEVKVELLSLKNTPHGMWTYFVLTGNPQTINYSNEFGQVALDICEEVENQDGNEVILNGSTGGVSWEVEWNK